MAWQLREVRDGNGFTTGWELFDDFPINGTITVENRSQGEQAQYWLNDYNQDLARRQLRRYDTRARMKGYANNYMLPDVIRYGSYYDRSATAMAWEGSDWLSLGYFPPNAANGPIFPAWIQRRGERVMLGWWSRNAVREILEREIDQEIIAMLAERHRLAIEQFAEGREVSHKSLR